MKQTKTFSRLLILTACIMILFSCSSTKKIKTAATEQEVVYSLTETYWKLIELNGEPMVPSETNKKEMNIIIKKDGNIVNGHGGCNSFRGTYTLLEGTDRITFSQMASTLMACIDMKKETEFMDVLLKVDNYSIKGNILSLNKARMAPLAKFEAVYLR